MRNKNRKFKLRGISRFLFLFMGLILIAVQAMAQQPVTEQITTVTGEPVTEATVVIKGISTGTDSNSDGDFTLITSQPEKAFVERNGVVVMEVESVAYDSPWVLETKAKGFSGEGYLTWNGENMFKKDGAGTLTFQVFVHNPGIYYLQLHNFHDHPDYTQNNDLFTLINGGDWIKTYSHVNNEWTWHTGFDINHTWGGLPRFELKAGLNSIQFSGRSKGFSIDRLALVVAEKLWMETWQTQPESKRVD